MNTLQLYCLYETQQQHHCEDSQSQVPVLVYRSDLIIKDLVPFRILGRMCVLQTYKTMWCSVRVHHAATLVIQSK